MSTLKANTITNSDGTGPPSFPFGFNTGTGGSSPINNIGVMGQQGACVGICPGPLPTGFAEMFGTKDPASDNYGNYIYVPDGSVMVWRPAHYEKIGTGVNGLAVNVIDIKPFSYFASVAAANAAGYSLPRSFYDAGAIQPGYFEDKYVCSNNGGVASSLKNGNPLSSAADHNPFSGLTGAPPNAYYGAIQAAKTRGSRFFPRSRFMQATAAKLSIAHGQAATSNAFCAWYDGARVINFPKGCNNNALGDVNDAAIRYVSDGYSNCGKTGSANLFARCTDNGQNCGQADVNGLVWEIGLGCMTIGAQAYVAKLTAAMKDFTGGNTLATDHWGAAGAAALFDAITLVSGTANNFFGNGGNQVLSEATAGDAWKLTGLGFPKDVNAISGAGAALFGNDYYYNQTVSTEMCLLSSGSWADSGGAGASAVYLVGSRGASSSDVSFRCACYL
ncbi:MAG: hypothetical protein WCI45_03195 [Desulfuromonadales bacterium]